MIELRYIGKEPLHLIGGANVIHLEKGDTIQLHDKKAMVFLQDSKLWQKTEKAKKEAK
jgi:hypothetical protein